MDSSHPELHLVRTKLYISPPHPELVDRSALTPKLKDGLIFKIILVTDPAGYGKITQLSTCIQHTNIDNTWISLDERDNESNRYCSNLEAAKQSFESAIIKTA